MFTDPKIKLKYYFVIILQVGTVNMEHYQRFFCKKCGKLDRYCKCCLENTTEQINTAS